MSMRAKLHVMKDRGREKNYIGAHTARSPHQDRSRRAPTSTPIYPAVASSLGSEVGVAEARSHGLSLGLAGIFGATRPLGDFDLRSRDEACGLEDRLSWQKGTIYHRGGHLIAVLPGFFNFLLRIRAHGCLLKR